MATPSRFRCSRGSDAQVREHFDRTRKGLPSRPRLSHERDQARFSRLRASRAESVTVSSAYAEPVDRVDSWGLVGAEGGFGWRG